MKKNTTLSSNIIYLGIVQGSNYILPLLTFPYLVRILGPVNFGILGFCQATIQYLILLIDYGFNWTATQSVARDKDNSDKVQEIFWCVMWSKSLLLMIALCILLGLCYFIPQYQKLFLILLAFIPGMVGNVIYPVWLFQGMEKMKWLTIASIISRTLVVPLTFIYVNDSSDIFLAALIQSCVNFFAGLIALSIILKEGWITGISFKPRLILKCLSDGWHVFLSTSAISLYSTGLIVILGFISGPIAVGYFNAANTIRNAAQGLLSPITQAIYPRINNLLIADRKSGILLIKKSLKYLSYLSLFFSGLLLIGSHPLVDIGIGKGYETSVYILMILSPLPFIVSLSNIYGIQIMLTHNYKKQFTLILFSGGITCICLIVPLTLLWGAIGAALVLLITELFVTIRMYKFVKNNKILD